MREGLGSRTPPIDITAAGQITLSDEKDSYIAELPWTDNDHFNIQPGCEICRHKSNSQTLNSFPQYMVFIFPSENYVISVFMLLCVFLVLERLF